MCMCVHVHVHVHVYVCVCVCVCVVLSLHAHARRKNTHRSIDVCRAVGIGLRQKAHDGEKNLVDALHGRPPVPKAAGPINVRGAETRARTLTHIFAGGRAETNGAPCMAWVAVPLGACFVAVGVVARRVQNGDAHSPVGVDCSSGAAGLVSGVRGRDGLPTQHAQRRGTRTVGVEEGAGEAHCRRRLRVVVGKL